MKKILILIVEDDQAVVDFLTSCLKSENYEVKVAYGGLQGCRKALDMKPDLIILDLLMPDIHGFDVCQILRRVEFLRDVKILISTAKAYPQDRKATEHLGADGFLSKPYTSDQLLEVVKKLVGEVSRP